MNEFRVDFTPPSVMERSARIAEGEGIQDEERRLRQDSKRKRRKRQEPEKDGEEARDEERKDEETGKLLDLEA